jgi:Hsp20/alpha crystallin family
MAVARYYSAFWRWAALAPGVDGRAIAAQAQEGVVEVTIPLPRDSTKRPIELVRPDDSDQAGETAGAPATNRQNDGPG